MEPPSSDRKQYDQRRLELFAVRCRDLRDRLEAGSIGFVDAVDLAYSAAIWAGLVDDVGDDAVQDVMGLAFADVPPEKRQ
jgi:hypothetical protein